MGAVKLSFPFALPPFGTSATALSAPLLSPSSAAKPGRQRGAVPRLPAERSGAPPRGGDSPAPLRSRSAHSHPPDHLR